MRGAARRIVMGEATRWVAMGESARRHLQKEPILDQIYPPGDDTHLLLRAALDETRPSDDVLEIGCGMGIISRKIAPLANSFVSTDINPNAACLVKGYGISTIQADLFFGIKGRFDLVLFNPPYLPTPTEERLSGWLNRAFDGGESGRDTIIRFLKDLRPHLRPGGRALLLISTLTGIGEVIEEASRQGLDSEQLAAESHFFEKLIVLRLTESRRTDC